MMIHIDLSLADTRPGGAGVFAPPADFNGSPADYLSLMRKRYHDPAMRQYLAIMARTHNRRSKFRLGPLLFRGPYIGEAKSILENL